MKKLLTLVSGLLFMINAFSQQQWNIPNATTTDPTYVGSSTSETSDVVVGVGGSTVGLKLTGGGTYKGAARFTSAYLTIGTAGSGYFNWPSAGNLYFRTLSDATNLGSTATTRMTLTSSGQLGIGIVPSWSEARLHVYGSSNPQFLIASPDAYGTLAVSTCDGCHGNDAKNKDVVLYSGPGSTSNNLMLLTTAEGKSIKFATTTTTAEGQRVKMLVGGNGNVGIGTGAESLPSALLELKRNGGDASKGKNVMLKLTNTWNSNTGALNEPTILFDNGTTSTTYGTYGWALGAQVAGPSYFRIGRYTSATTYNEYFRIKDDGKIFMGDGGVLPATGNHKLYVGGTIVSVGMKCANTGNWPDFVFDKDYKLKSLESVEAFIKENRHLPEIPSAEEVGKDGVDLVQMDAKLLQKIEELTLYMIEMKKENEALKNNNQLLMDMIKEIEVKLKK